MFLFLRFQLACLSPWICLYSSKTITTCVFSLSCLFFVIYIYTVYSHFIISFISLQFSKTTINAGIPSPPTGFFHMSRYHCLSLPRSNWSRDQCCDPESGRTFCPDPCTNKPPGKFSGGNCFLTKCSKRVKQCFTVGKTTTIKEHSYTYCNMYIYIHIQYNMQDIDIYIYVYVYIYMYHLIIIIYITHMRILHI